ncbi:hypothetical protein NM208_g12897 [Fusarium decemcellulare]|uniref:Uncharacterized protein n=1 Tax=Fusarium decemcellulare TaxID=57161 RepID=A0ACC1RPK4_9HYPO|nr:hypothetical protein NM208_g12897 [Fusarium decemcellulare]
MEAAASVIAFVQISTEVVKCMVKTKQLWDQSRDLPGEIQGLIKRLEGYIPIFKGIQKQLCSQDFVSALEDDMLIADSLAFCMRAHRTLESTVEDLTLQLNAKKGFKRRLAAVKMVIGKDKLDQLKNKLSDSIELLNLSCMAWNMAVARRTPEVIVSRITRQINTYAERVQAPTPTVIEITEDSKHTQKDISVETVETVSEDTTEQHNQSTLVPRRAQKLVKTYYPSKLGRFALAYTTGTGAWQAYVQWPSWLSSSVCEVQSSPAVCGWTYSYRVYNIISPKSEIITKITTGDKAGVLELFNSRKASPFDKDPQGCSLLWYATTSKNFELCQLLLSLGLQGTLCDERGGLFGRSPLAPSVRLSDRDNPGTDWMKIVDLFNSYMDEPESNMIMHLLDYRSDRDEDDDSVRAFQQRFLPKFYNGPLRARLEAFRMGSLTLQSPRTVLGLLTQNEQITSFHVNHSSHEKLSIVHSVAIALGQRFAGEVVPYNGGYAMWRRARKYTKGWNDLVQQAASVAEVEDLHMIETIQMWDIYAVPAWRGTPLISVIGGALCYISPDISFFQWDAVFQQCLQRWVTDLQEGGVDLESYGKREAVALRTQMRDAFDADAIESSKPNMRDSLGLGAAEMVFGIGGRLDDRRKWNVNHWVPIRLLDLETGPAPSDWRITWVPEFEWMACQFWAMMEKENVIMPGQYHRTKSFGGAYFCNGQAVKVVVMPCPAYRATYPAERGGAIMTVDGRLRVHPHLLSFEPEHTQLELLFKWLASPPPPPPQHLASNSNMATRPAEKAGLWYNGDPEVLKQELQEYLAAVPESVDQVPVPIPGARVVIAPHAGYDYSGPCAAWAYKSLDLSQAKRVFVLGPSHTYYLKGCAVSVFGEYATPFGNLVVDQEMVQEVKEAGAMDDMFRLKEVKEHSLEMHMPYLYLRCEETFGSPDKFPKIVPLLIGSNEEPEEKAVGEVLLPYLKDPENAFVISSDFCHWGSHFDYMVYYSSNSPGRLDSLKKTDPVPSGPPIHETIRVIDEAAMDAIKSGSHDAFRASLEETNNTVCGRHPIGVIMAALELLVKEPEYKDKGRFSIIQYNRSNLVRRPDEFSVSYVSAYAVV